MLEAFRTPTFRASLTGAAIYGAATLLLFGFIYWQTASYERTRLGQFLRHEATAMMRASPDEIVRDVALRYSGDLHRITFAAVFDGAGQRIEGDIAAYPDGLPADGMPRDVIAAHRIGDTLVGERMIAVARRLPDGRALVVARSEAELAELRAVVSRALALGLVPAIVLAIGAGTLASLRAMARVRAVNEAIARVMRGDLRGRLPARGTSDTLDQLASGVNRMLDDLERLIDEVKGVSDSIAHDLRTPLTRLKSHLEGGRRRAATLADLDQTVERALADLDRAFAIITALLRIGEIESAQRRASFADVSLNAIAEEAADLYQPMAELRDVALGLRAEKVGFVFGDRDLLFEAVANLLDNAIKFTPPGGAVRLTLASRGADVALRISDTGPGIPAPEREAVLRRFYRTERTMGVEGSGLGLSLVAAILNLHGFALTMSDEDPGFTIEIVCPAPGGSHPFGS